MSEDQVPELRHAVDLMAQSRVSEGDYSSATAAAIAEADHILGPILEHAEPSHIYTDHLLGPDHTDAPLASGFVEVAHAPSQLEPSQLEPAYAAAPAVASGVNPVEGSAPAAHDAALTARSARDPAARSLNMANSGETVVDPVLAGFDHIVALVSYGLLFVSVFLLGVPALAAAALAYAHKRDSHVIVATHYRFQLRIFWTAILLLALGVISAAGASVILLQKLFDYASAHLPGISGVIGHGSVAWTAPLAGALGLAWIGFFVLAVGWTLIASLVGFFRLLANKPIGHLPASR